MNKKLSAKAFSVVAFITLSVVASQPLSASPATMVTFELNALTDVTFLNLNTHQALTFTPVVTGSSSVGNLKGRAHISIPEGIYLFNGTEHQPAELGTICKFPDRVVIVKERLERFDIQSPAFTYITSGPDVLKFKKDCYEDFHKINTVPDFINPR